MTNNTMALAELAESADIEVLTRRPQYRVSTHSVDEQVNALGVRRRLQEPAQHPPP